MATKRNKRIDPNAAFAAIVGNIPQEEAAPAAAEKAPVKQAAPKAEAPAAPAEETPKLVQKGYYITEELHRQLGLASVLQGTDRSAIVRQALEMYFDANKEALQ